MSKKKIFIAGIIVSIFLFCSIFAYAYFTNVIDGNTHNVSASLNDSTIVEVDTFEKFVDATRLYDTSKDDEFNSNNSTSNSSKRKTIRLLVDIRMTSDVLVTADCHIDLNGNTLYLSGYDLTFKHQFDGVFAVYNGKIDDDLTDDKGRIIVDCPNACIDFDDKTLVTNANIDIIKAAPTYVINSAMNLVYSNIQTGGINDFYTTIETLEDFGLDICKENTSFTHDKGTYCIYTFDDLDLIYSYFGYKGLEVTYESSNKDVLTNGGRILSTEVTTTVELTITITYQEQTLTKIVNVHVLNEEDYVYASNAVLLIYLQKYHNGEEYEFNKTFLMPNKNSYFNTTYHYTLKSENFTYESDTNRDYFDPSLYTDYISIGLSKEIEEMIIVSKDDKDNSATSPSYSVKGEASSIVDDNQSYAVGIVQLLYGNQITIRDGQITLSEYSEYLLLCDPTINGYARLDSISYVLDDSEGIYELVDFEESSVYYQNHQLLRVKKDGTMKPYISQTVFLEIHFDFTAAYQNEQITIIVPVVYEPSIVDGQGFDQFDPYYVHFNKEFNDVTKNYTYESFSIPLTFEGKYPTYAFLVYVQGDNGFELVNSNLIKIVPTASSYANIKDTDLMNITIDPYYVNKEDTTYYFAYIPVYTDPSGNVIYYTMEDGPTDDISTININPLTYQYVSTLTIPGIVRYNKGTFTSEAFADLEFYKIAYELLNGQGSFVENKTFILTNTLENYIDVVDFSSANTSLLKTYNYSLTLGTIANNDNIIGSLQGIELLKGINKLTFNGTTALGANSNFVTNLGYVSQITNLHILDLGSTNIYDQTSGTLSFPSGDDNGFLTTLSALTNLRELNLANNKIYDFTALANFASLQKVNVGGNTFSNNTNIIGGVITSIINGLYGSNGATNIGVFATLQSNGCTIEGSGSTANVPEGTQAIINALSSLEYQDRLSKNVNLATVVSQYASGNNVYSAYDLKSSYTIDGDYEIVFNFTSVAFEVASDGSSFTMLINYHWTVDTGILTGTQEGDVQYTYTYKITRY